MTHPVTPHPRPAGDLLSELFPLSPHSAGRLLRVAGGEDWAIKFSAKGQIRVGAVFSGSCRIRVDTGNWFLLGAGDCYILHPLKSTVMAGSESALPRDGDRLVNTESDDSIYLGGCVRPGTRTARPIFVEAAIGLPLEKAELVRDSIPAAAVFDHTTADARRIHSTLALALYHDYADGPGAPVVASKLAEIALIHALRAIIRDTPKGWFGAFHDPQVGAAMALMHRDPSRNWTVADLGSSVGMSRASFAARFKDRVGVSPIDYLKRWRIISATADITEGVSTVASVGAKWGYSSTSAFNAAFKRVTGMTPVQYRGMGPAVQTDQAGPDRGL